MLKVSEIQPLIERFKELEEKLKPVPEDWIIEFDEESGSQLPIIYCNEWNDVQAAWEDAMSWSPGLEAGLIVMLASVISTNLLGDQLWVKIIGPPSCGKTTLVEAVATNRKYTLSKSTIRGFHTGYVDKSGEDKSLTARCKGKTLLTKDGDTLLQSPNVSQILSEARDLYDTVARTSYRNSAGKDYSGLRMTWILCGTSSLRSLDNSELGERFLDCVLMDSIEDAKEDAVLLKVVKQSEKNVETEASESAEGFQDPEKTRAMQLTGGYVEYLRENASSLVKQVRMPGKMAIKCARLGKFVAHMRARPSSYQQETFEREFAARLAGQITRLTKCVGAVLGKDVVDSEVIALSQKVALDTSRGLSYNIAKICYGTKENNSGATSRTLAAKCNQTAYEINKFLRFMKGLGIIEIKKSSNKSRTTALWALSDRFVPIWQAAHKEL